MTEDEMVGWHHRLNGHEFEQALGNSEGQEVSCAAAHGVTKSWTCLATEHHHQPGGTSGKEPACQHRRRKRRGFDAWVGKIPWRRAWQPTPYSCLENPMDRGAWWAKSQTRLK